MKKVLLIIIASFVLISLCACNKDNIEKVKDTVYISEYDLEYANNQLDNIHSPLIKKILEVCNKISIKVQKPVYFHFPIGTNINVCPKCGSKLENIPIDITKYSEYSNIDKVCKNCNLVFSTNKK